MASVAPVPMRRWTDERGFALCAFDALVHVGTLREKDKGIRGPSLEGDGLSVSTCPQAWVQIAKLGGLPWFELRRPDNAFLDAHRLVPWSAQDIVRWGLDNAFVGQVTLWRATRWDDELESEVFSLHTNRDEALAESHDGADVRSVPGLAARPALAARMNQRVEPLQVEPLLQVVFAQDILEVDGVFWDDELDVSRWSAPRAVLFRHRLPQWEVRQMRSEEPLS